jgi:beta-N-acetylhexosaminidase
VSRRLLTLCVCALAASLPVACGGGDDGGLRPGPANARVRSVVETPTATTTRARVTAAVARPTRHERIAALRPRIVRKPIALTAKRRQETAAYADRHYGIRSATIDGPHVIVEHYTVTPDFPSTYAVFAPDTPDVELHELPGLCSQFVVDRDGTIYQLTPVRFMCRHTVGLNYTAIGIEHVGSSDREVLTDAAQMRASLKLTRWLRCRSQIGVGNVIGHSESLGSRYHRELVAALRTQTHDDWTRADMRTYRQRLRALGTCPR